MTPVLISLFLIATLFWCMQLLSLMQMSDDQFPGRFDKLIWAIILLGLYVLGALLFFIWKTSVRAEQQSAAVANRLAAIVRRSRAEDDAT